MGRWRWLVLMGMLGLGACGPESAPSLPEPPDRTGENPLPTTPDGGTPPSEDAGTPDTGAPDAGAPDAGKPDAGAPDAGPPPLEFPPVQSRIPSFDLQIAPEHLAWLEQNPETDETVPVTVVLDGESAPGQLRFRGASTRTLPQKSFKIELDPGYEFADRDHFELLAEWYDSGKLTEKFAVDLYTAMKLPVPRASYVKVSINGQPNGLYVDMEHVGKDYLKHHGLERNASIYRCGHRNCEMTPRPGSYQTDFEKKTNEDTGRADLDTFLAWVNRSDDAEFEAKLERHVDVEAYLGNLAADMLISNNIVEDSRSYWVHEHGKDRWQYVPWDLNNARMLFWRTWAPTDPPIEDRWAQPFTLYDPGVQDLYELRVGERPSQRPTWSVLATRVWDRPALRARMLAKLEAALAGPFSETKANAHIDALWARVSSELASDPYISPEHLARARGFLKQYVRERRAFLQRALQDLKAHGSGALVIREINAGSAGYVELYNRGTATLSLQGYEVTNDLRATTRYALPALTLEPGQTLRLQADGNTAAGPTHLPFTLSRQGGEVGLFNGNLVSSTGKPRLHSPEDVVYYGPLAYGTVYGRKTPASEDFERRPLVP
ncbi:CotH kinase family protein [Hyalangium rubrum]|uniref:CotH kinase family protein n=1 Tax=Hyalangium rubrum TaxID=3103134 RepID=A0ABU5HGV3_9BACT|nr:CotH kinase family protein [Hyalangium sp. s54d21]MDY7232374.1 CotH kinase family protein [Hyalangium sp. s54d21]